MINNNKFRTIVTFFLLLFSSSVAFCSNEDFDDEFLTNNIITSTNSYLTPEPIWLNNINKNILNINVKIYNKILPITSGNKQIPKYVDIFISGIQNIASTYSSAPKDFTISILDGDLEGAGISLWRFLINSTIGLFGIYDVAKEFNLQYFGKSWDNLLQFYHIPEGYYVVLPFVGPRTIRRAFGGAIEFVLNPLNFYFLSGGIVLSFSPLVLANYLNPAYLSLGNYIDLYIIASITEQKALFFKMHNASKLLNDFQASSLDIYGTYKILYYEATKTFYKKYLELKNEKKLRSSNPCNDIINVNYEDICYNDNEPQKEYYFLESSS